MEQYNDDQYRNEQNRYNAHYPHNNIDNQVSPNYENDVQYEPNRYNSQNNNGMHPNYTYKGYNNNPQSNGYPPNNMQNASLGQNTYQYSPNNAGYDNNYGTNEMTTNTEISNKNEQFLLFSLIIAISITAIVIGVGWTLFYPKPISEQIENPNNTDTLLAELQSNDESDSQDLVIIYGADDKSSKNNVASSTTTSIPNETVKKTETISSTQVKQATKPTSTQATKPKNIPSIATNTKYWIQIFSTNNRDKANKIQTDLDTQGIKAIIITKNINNSIFYRLRIGPYYNQDEGRKFLEWIRRNNKYRDAYISVEKG